MEITDSRKKEIVNACLEKLIENGLHNTTSRDLSGAINLQSGGLYYYFETKDDVIVACAEEAAKRIELNVIMPAFINLHNPQRLSDDLFKHSKKMAPTMRFFISVCMSKKYSEKIEPVLERTKERHNNYLCQLSQKLNCNVEVVSPYFYSCLSSITNYIIFDDESYMKYLSDILCSKLKFKLTGEISE